MATTSNPVCCAATKDTCGEGVLWHPEEQAVYWTDINRFLIHRYDPASALVDTWNFDQPVTTVLLTSKPGMLAVCLGSRVIFWEPASDTRRDHGFQLRKWPLARLNDAAIDPNGNLWVGSMRNNVNADGSESEAGGQDGILFRIDSRGTVTEWADEIGISNTLVWSPNKEWFYFGDSLDNHIWAYSYNSITSAILKVKPLFKDFDRGLPDGSTMDSDGYIWNCRYGGSCIVRLSQDGKVDQILEMPTRNITNCIFGGKDMNILYVTTAASADELGGNLFAMETDVAGLPENRFLIA
jgi:sugar lactone lactonase YvrE